MCLKDLGTGKTVAAAQARKTRPTRGASQDTLVGTSAQAALVDAWTCGMHPHTRAFLLYVLAATLDSARRQDEWGHAVAAVLIKRLFRRAEVSRLISEGRLEASGYSEAKGECREFRVAPHVLREFAEAGLTASTLVTGGLVDLSDGRRTTRRVKSVRTGPSGNALARLVRAAIDATGISVFNPASIGVHLDGLRRAVDAETTGRARTAAVARYITDLLCFQAVLAQGAQPVDAAEPGGLWTYRPAYRPQTFGRLSQIGGALQSCSRPMKEAAYAGVPDFRNYDLKASQAQILIVLLGEAGIDASWLEEYAVAGKAAAAAYVGVPVDVWKNLLYATLMGARIPSVGQLPHSDGAIAKAIREGVRLADAHATYGRFLAYTEGLRTALQTWHEWLGTEFVATCGRRNNIDGQIYLTNEVGAKVAVSALSAKPYRRRAQLAACLLQGREAAFVHALAASSAEFGFVVQSHEHDGLAVRGEIPALAVERAAVVARLPLSRVSLVEKPFV